MNNMLDTIYSIDVIQRLNDLELVADEISEDEAEELAVLREINSIGEDYVEDWQYGAELIRYSYFTEYAQDLAYEIGAVDNVRAAWPLNCIDWEQAAEELLWDYTSVDINGVVYYARSR